MVTDIHALAHRYFEEGWNQIDMTVIDELFAPDCVYYLNSDVVLQGTERMKEAILGTRSMFSELWFNVEEQLVDGDRIAARLAYGGAYQGGSDTFPASALGKSFSARGLFVAHLADGKIVAAWHSTDRLTQFRQLDLTMVPVSAS